ncbi:MAG: phospholipase D-like domain-containing protein [Pseudomonadota bacterium]
MVRVSLPVSVVIDAEVLPWLVVIEVGLLIPSIAHLLLFKSDYRVALGWLGLMLLVPFGGVLLYWLFGINRVRRAGLQVRGASSTLPFSDLGALPLLNPDAAVQTGPLEQVGLRVTGEAPCAGNAVKVLENGEQVFPRMLEDLAAARKEILLASFIFDYDELGETFVAALSEAHRRGVSVCVLVDDLGRRFRYPTVLAPLQRAGVPVRCFMPARLLPPKLNINLRNHRKLLIIDRAIGYTGGMNISARHLVAGDRADATTDVHFRFQGPVVSHFARTFEEDWLAADGPAEALSSGASHREPDLASAARVSCRVIEDGPGERIDRLPLLIVGALGCARRRIRLATPYFLPEERIVGALQSAALRGVEVAIVVPEQSNWRVIDWALGHGLWKLVNVGVRVYREPLPFSHAKYLLVDDDYALVGSANIDPRSLRLNYELNVEVFSDAVVGRLGAHFDRARMRSAPVTLDALRNRSLPVRLRDSVAALASGYL